MSRCGTSTTITEPSGANGPRVVPDSYFVHRKLFVYLVSVATIMFEVRHISVTMFCPGSTGSQIERS